MAKSSAVLGLALVVPLLGIFASRLLQSGRPDIAICAEQQYATEILSVDPLVIYINNFVNDIEVDYLLKLGDSQLYDNDHNISVDTPYRSSATAFLPIGDPMCHCVGKRALSFMGLVEHENYEPLQLVRYYPSQAYNYHTDWLHKPKTSKHTFDVGRDFNRLASFFTYMGGNSTGGETYFPHVKGVAAGGDGRKFSRTPNGGLVVKPIKGSALFWMNLHPGNGSGDERVIHAGLSPTSGVKYGMNVWTKHYRGVPIRGRYTDMEDRGDLEDLDSVMSLSSESSK